MNESKTKTKTYSINCPTCGTTIQLDKSSYSQILNQVSNDEIDRRTAVIQQQYDERITLLEKSMTERAAEKEGRLRAEYEKDAEERIDNARKLYAELKLSKDTEIANLKASLKASEKETELAVVNAQTEKDKVINSLNAKISALEEALSNKDAIVTSDMARIRAQLEAEKTSALMAAQEKREEEATELRERIAALESECIARDEMIESLKDFKMKLSTKLIGETLEQHCEQAYDRNLRPVLELATFEKDTALGEKGDYIFREEDTTGKEILSILFDMKNEDEMTSTSRKKRNKDHFAKLDKDRARRGCEYAVLVSTLEPDSEAYSAGITRVTEYEKMFVVRPQLFLDLIHILRAVAKDKAKLSNELDIERKKNVDVTQFESNLEAYKKNIEANAARAERFSVDAIKSIDKVIDSLEAIKERLISWQRQNNIAHDKAEKLTLKTLTKGNPTVTALFEALADPDGVEIIDVGDDEVITTTRDTYTN